ncbi:hypothetical protein J3Q64DRAFT_1839242 [Phycomyces blakesleeanus]|uniref:F-box domain-containing protein n=2 Tax=Phycomyces blakesleeanus TaxID=4837 RepID=A0A167KMH8_PHYB8|nr:hypothetical protein PHYBLDRAFT_150608 [Phycomyces blakesleeanus NRRL 1555(-)]OAD68429.1 hypothetical protein PHYBLDRAFT_150608 [Phycomyces blakesleeanus NRRL 1555(-)]|eukprot:XP_018286469.1 hypothetical protein PHYBLDRAFT_150608 [Phycomyces blakesleeanus NRRL 1555(-)]
MLDNLPEDIISSIIHLLTQKDQATCVRVSRHWHNIFQSSLYSTIQLKNERTGNLFLKSGVMDISSTSASDFRYLVRSMTLRWAIGQKVYPWRLLLRSFPFLEDLSVSSMLWNNLVKENGALPNLTRLATNCKYTPIDLSDVYAKNLTHFSAMRFQKRLLCSLIIKMPMLKDLTIQVIQHTPDEGSPSLEFQDIDNIHGSCKHIQTIHLRNLTLAGNALIEQSQATTVRYFKLKNVKVTEPEWIVYFIKKYPRLLKISIQVIRAPWDDQFNPRMVYRYEDALGEIKSGFIWSDLEILSLSNITDNKAYFSTLRLVKLLAPSYNLKQLEIYGSRVKPFSVDLNINWALKNFSGLRVLKLNRINVIYTSNASFVNSCLTHLELDINQCSDELLKLVNDICPQAHHIMLM